MGSSIGAVLCALFAHGYTPFEILLIMLEYMPLSSTNLKRISQLLDDKLDYTFQELFDRTGKRLIVPVYDYKRTMAVYYSHELTPVKRVSDAVKESINPVPFDRTTMDGCICEPFPVGYCKRNGYGKIFGVYCRLRDGESEVDSFFQSIKAYFGFVMNKMTDYEVALAGVDDSLSCFHYGPELDGQMSAGYESLDVFIDEYAALRRGP